MFLLLAVSFYQAGFAQDAGKLSVLKTTNPIVLPVRYDEDRFYVQPVMTNGTILNFFTDTGGSNFIFADDGERLHLEKTSVKTDNGQTFETISMPNFITRATIPEPLGSEGRLFVGPVSGRTPTHRDWTGMLGQNWFAGRIWTFDYPNKRLLLRATGDLPKHKAEQEIHLGFRTTKDGNRSLNYPRMTAVIDNEPIDLLLDTGASVNLSAATVDLLKDKRPAYRAASFIIASIFEKWRKAHPDWLVIDKSDVTGAEAMIEVPQVTVAGHTVGPVWFTRKPDFNFYVYLNPVMDKRVDGALGGNALKFFRVTVDYPNALAVFEK